MKKDTQWWVTTSMGAVSALVGVLMSQNVFPPDVAGKVGVGVAALGAVLGVLFPAKTAQVATPVPKE